MTFYGIESKAMVPSIFNNSPHPVGQNEPRIFFRQMIEASGLFPIEINVPDTISSMASGMSWMYETVSSYFNSGSQVEEGDQTQQQQVSYDEVNQNRKPINGRHRKKKVKKVKKKIDIDDDESIFDFINFLIF